MIYLYSFPKPGRLRITEGISLRHNSATFFKKKSTTHDINLFCTLPRRLLIMTYDGVILFGLLIIASAIALPFGNVEKIAFEDFWFTFWLLLVYFAYLGGCWRYGGMTVGMRAWKVKLIRQNNEAISWSRCLLRFMAMFISVATLGLGFLWALVDKKKRCWHDLLADTVLVRQE